MDFDTYMAMLNPETQMQVGSFYGRGSAIRANAMRGGGFAGPFGGSTQNYGGGYINPYRYSGMNPKDSPGDKLFADIIRAQTADYETRFAPLEDALAGMITRTGTTNLAGDLERTRGAITGAAQNVQGMANRSAEQLGIAGAKMDTTNTSSTLVGGLNETRQREADRRLQLLTGVLSGITQGVRNVG